MQFTGFRNNRHVVAEAMIDRKYTEDLSQGCKELSEQVLIDVYMNIDNIPKQGVLEAEPLFQTYSRAAAHRRGGS